MALSHIWVMYNVQWAFPLANQWSCNDPQKCRLSYLVVLLQQLPSVSLECGTNDFITQKSLFLTDKDAEKKKISWQQIHPLLVIPDSIHSVQEDVFYFTPSFDSSHPAMSSFRGGGKPFPP